LKYFRAALINSPSVNRSMGARALNPSWFFDPKAITVTGENGKIRLIGTVRTPYDRQVAAATAWAAPGVIDVKNEIRIT
jgi:osmotically-inducible protein OsmY